MSNFKESQLLELARDYAKKATQNAEANPTEDSIQIVVVEPGEKPFKHVIPNNLESMSDIVGGYIEIVNMKRLERGITLILTLNEEGKLLSLPFNRRVVNFDILVGTFFISAYNMLGDNVSLTDEECEKLIRQFSPIEVHI